MRNPPEPVRIESVPGLRDGSPGMHEATEPRPPRRGFFMPPTHGDAGMLSNAGQHRIVLRDGVLSTACKPEHVLLPDPL